MDVNKQTNDFLYRPSIDIFSLLLYTNDKKSPGRYLYGAKHGKVQPVVPTLRSAASTIVEDKNQSEHSGRTGCTVGTVHLCAFCTEF